MTFEWSLQHMSRVLLTFATLIRLTARASLPIMGPEPTDLAEELELDGTVPELDVNDEVPIPEGERRRAHDHVREYVERERARLEARRAAEPDPERLAREEAFRELLAERIAEELGLGEEYANLRERRRASSDDGANAETDDGDSGGDDE